MAQDIVTLGLAVDSTPVVKATDNLDKLTAAGGRADGAAKRVGDGWSKASQQIAADTARSVAAMDKMNAEQQRTNLLLASLNMVVGDAAAAQGRLATATNKATQEAKQQGDAIKRSTGEVDGFKAALQGVAVVAAAAFAARQVLGYADAIYKASAAAQNLRTTLDFASGGKGGAELAYITKTADRLGLQLSSTAKAYASFAAATKDTAIEGKATRDIFESVAKASAVMGLSADQSAGALLALQQMVSKGTVQAEELRGQLGERIPGAFQIAANAMNVTTAQLGKMLEKGEVVASDFLPRFAAALSAHVGDAAEKAADRLDASTNRMGNAWDKLLQTVGGSGVADFMSKQMNRGADAMTSISEAMLLAKASGGGFVSQMWAAQGAVLDIVNPISGVTAGTAALSERLKTAEKNLADLQARGGANTQNIYLRAAYADASALVGKLREAQNALNAVSGGAVAGAGRGSVNPTDSREMARQEAARTAERAAYLDNDQRQTRAQIREEKIAKARVLNEKMIAAAAGDTNEVLKLRAALETEIANINETHKDKKAGGSGAAEIKKEQNAYEQLLASIRGKVEADKQELALGRSLTDSEKFRVKLQEEMKAGKLSLSDAHRKAIEAGIVELAGMEAAERARKREAVLDAERLQIAAELDAAHVAESKAREAGNAAVDAYVQKGDDALQLQQNEIANLGRTAAERTLSNAQLQIELERRKAIEAIGKNTGYDAAGRATAEGQVNSAAASATVNADQAAAVERLHKFMDPDRAQDFGDALSDAFEGALNPLKKLTTSLEKYGKEQRRINQARKDADFLDDDKKEIVLQQAKAEEMKNQLGMYGDMAGAAAGFFDKQSSGYKALMAVSQAFHTAQMAMTMAQQVQAAILAVLGQAQGDPYSAFVRMAAMIAFVGSLGVALSGGGGGGSGDTYTKPVAGTGTVLGMEGEKSESIGNSIDLLADNSKVELTYTQRMLSELTKVREGIMGLAGTASRDFFSRGIGAASASSDFQDSGIGFFSGQSVADILTRGIAGASYQLFQGDKGGMRGSFQNLDSQFVTSVSSILGDVARTITTAAESLGLADSGLTDRMLSLIPTLGDTSNYAANGITGAGGGTISFADMSGKEIQEELEAIFSSVGDQMAAAALPALVPFQRVGEGMFETLMRVTTGIESANYALEQMGIQAIEYTEIVRRNGEIDVEIIRQSLMRNEAQDVNGPGWVTSGKPTPSGPVGLTGVAEILDVFVGTAQELVDLYGALSDVRNLLRSVGENYIDLSVAMVRGAGGIENLTGGLEDYLENYFTEQERAAAALARVTERAAALGIALPETTEGFRTMVESIDTSTDAGAMLFGQLMSLSGGFAEATGQVQALKDAEVERLAEVAQAERDRIEAIEDAQKASWSRLNSALDGIVGEFLEGDALREFRAGRISERLQTAGLNISPEQVLGASKADFEELYRSLDKGSTAGREQAASLLDVWAAFRQLLPVTQDLAAGASLAMADLERSVAAQRAALTANYNAQREALTASTAAAMEATRAQVDAANEAARVRVDAITEIFNALEGAIDSAKVESRELSRVRRESAQGVLRGAVQAGRAGRSLAGYAGLPEALADLAEPSELLYATFEDYAVDQARTANDIETLRSMAGAQKSTAEMQLAATTLWGETTIKTMQLASDAELAALTAQYEADLAALDQTLEYWRTQLDIANGTYRATLTVADAVLRLSRAIEDMSAVDGSHALGLERVPFDGYRAELHQGERVLTEKEAAEYRNGPAPAQAQPAAVEDTADRRLDRMLLRRIAENTSTSAKALNGARNGNQPLAINTVTP